MEYDNTLAGICVVGAGGPCNGENLYEISHKYAKKGSYKAVLRVRTEPCSDQYDDVGHLIYGNDKCIAPVKIEVTDTAVINVR